MYLVELRPGKEELYRSGDELAAAIRRGDVDVHSRIYHRATSKWISVTLHPQFKAIVAEKVAEPLPALDRHNWTYLTDQAETLHVAEGSEGRDGGSGEVPSTMRGHPWRRLFGLGVAGTALVLGAQLAFSGPRPPWAGADETPALQPAAAGEEAAEAPQVVSLASSSSAWQPEAPAAEPAATRPPRADSVRSPLPRAPQLRLKTLKDVLPTGKPEGGAVAANTIEGLLSSYGAAYGAARERLETGMRVARLHQLFSPARLTPDGGLTDTRLALAGVANFIRVYRQQEIAIEQEYQDTFTVMSKAHGWSARAVRRWYARGAQKEPAAFANLSTRLLASLDSLLGVLDEEAGAYRLGDGTIAFEDANAMRRYGVLRKEITQMIDTARAAGGEESSGPIGLLLQAVGTTQLPREI
jgi:hypothetical protein